MAYYTVTSVVWITSLYCKVTFYTVLFKGALIYFLDSGFETERIGCIRCSRRYRLAPTIDVNLFSAWCRTAFPCLVCFWTARCNVGCMINYWILVLLIEARVYCFFFPIGQQRVYLPDLEFDQAAFLNKNVSVLLFIMAGFRLAWADIINTHVCQWHSIKLGKEGMLYW